MTIRRVLVQLGRLVVTVTTLVIGVGASVAIAQGTNNLPVFITALTFTLFVSSRVWRGLRPRQAAPSHEPLPERTAVVRTTTAPPRAVVAPNAMSRPTPPLQGRMSAGSAPANPFWLNIKPDWVMRVQMLWAFGVGAMLGLFGAALVGLFAVAALGPLGALIGLAAAIILPIKIGLDEAYGVSRWRTPP